MPYKGPVAMPSAVLRVVLDRDVHILHIHVEVAKKMVPSMRLQRLAENGGEPTSR